MDDMTLRALIYRHVVDTGTAPTRHELTDIIGADPDAHLRRLHDAHMIVQDDRPPPTFQPKTIEQLQRLLTEVGLTSNFWQLQQ